MVIPVMIGVTLASFFMLHLAPGDPAELLAGDDATQEIIESIREEYGLDKPLYVQYLVSARMDYSIWILAVR